MAFTVAMGSNNLCVACCLVLAAGTEFTLTLIHINEIVMLINIIY